MSTVLFSIRAVSVPAMGIGTDGDFRRRPQDFDIRYGAGAQVIDSHKSFIELSERNLVTAPVGLSSGTLDNSPTRRPP
jgi:hypothetical protein